MEGPFEIIEVLSPVTYQLKLLKSWKIHDVFHAMLLKLYWETEMCREIYPWPLPILEGEELYKVEAILNHRKLGQTYQFFVKWSSYLISEASWEPEVYFQMMETPWHVTNSDITWPDMTFPLQHVLLDWWTYQLLGEILDCLSTQISENGHLCRRLQNLWAAHWSPNTLPHYLHFSALS